MLSDLIKKFNALKLFDKASVKLTSFYVLIVMIISIFFSVALFSISSGEIERGLGRQSIVLHDFQVGLLPPNTILNLENIREKQLKESNQILMMDLVYFNLLILVLSTLLSYYLARKSLEPIEKAMELQNRFTADASHELRTPLTAMKSEIEVNLRDKKLGINDAKKLLTSNLEEIGKLELLSNALLKLARADGDYSSKFDSIPLSDIIIEAYERVEGLADDKKTEIVVSGLESSGQTQVLGDKQSLTELFVILLDNAIKYSPKNSKIKIIAEAERRHVVVKIKDHGIGIKASDLSYIFNRFYRADTSRCKDQVCGYGLGLSIAKRIVEIHDGDIEVTSKPGKGSQFQVKLPSAK